MESALVKAVVDLDAIAHNTAALNAMTPEQTLFMAVVKADGYGHGAVTVAKKALEAGADWLGVARLHEAIELRNAGIIAPILVFGYVHPERVDRAVDLNLTLSVYDLAMARQLSDQAAAAGKSLDVHLKVDTGMGRVGRIVPNPSASDPFRIAIDEIEAIQALPGIQLKGMYTHFASADEADKTYTLGQILRFEAVISSLKQKGIRIPICHAANSAGIIAFPQAHFDMVRAGISLYGFYPSPEMDQTRVLLRPAMTLTSIVSAVREVPRGFKVSYGMTHETQQPTRLASVPIGYADGFSRAFTNSGQMLVKGTRAPIVGRVCMDQTMIDVGHIPDVAAGDEVVIFGCQGTERLSADEQAGRIHTIHYEMVSALTRRVKRVYVSSASG